MPARFYQGGLKNQLSLICFHFFQISQYLKREFARDGKKRDPSDHDIILTDIFKKNDHDGDGFISAKEYNVYQHDEL